MWYLFIKLYYIGKSQFILFFTTSVYSAKYDARHMLKNKGAGDEGKMVKWYFITWYSTYLHLNSYMQACTYYLPIYHQLDCNRRKKCYILGFSWQKTTLFPSAKPWKIIIIKNFGIFFKEWKISWHKTAIGTLFHKNNDYFFVSIFSSKFFSPPLDLCSLYSSEIDLFSNQ